MRITEYSINKWQQSSETIGIYSLGKTTLFQYYQSYIIKRNYIIT